MYKVKFAGFNWFWLKFRGRRPMLGEVYGGIVSAQAMIIEEWRCGWGSGEERDEEGHGQGHWLILQWQITFWGDTSLAWRILH